MDWRRGAILAAILLCAGPAAAFDQEGWPCVQRKVQHLSWGQMWTGDPPPIGEPWRDDPVIAPLAAKIAARRTEIDTIDGLIAAEPDLTGADRLGALFAAAFELIDRERSRIVDGTTRFAEKQRLRAEEIDGMRVEIDKLRADAADDDYDALDKIEEMEDSLAWDTRIYQDRQKSLKFVCESPVILEKRAFEVARIIQARLEGD